MKSIIKIDQDKCTGCGNCVSACSHGVIKLISGKAAINDSSACDGAGACIGTCPKGAISFEQGRTLSCPAFSAKRAKKSFCPNWPLQLSIVNGSFGYPPGSSAVFAADCTAFSSPDIYKEASEGKLVFIGCPKHYERSVYVGKICEIIKNNTFSTLTVLHMEVPCCTALLEIVRQALKESGRTLALKSVVVKL